MSVDIEKAAEYIKPFKTRENISAVHHEQALGITYAQKPFAIDTDIKNRWQLLKKGRGSFNMLFNGIRKGMNAEGFYIRAGHALFTEPDCNPLVELHENIHGYVALQTDEPEYAWGHLEEDVQMIGYGKKPEYDAEELVVTEMFNEAFCHYAAFLTATRLPEVYDQNLAHQFVHGYVMAGHSHEGGYHETAEAFRLRKLREAQILLSDYKSSFDAGKGLRALPSRTTASNAIAEMRKVIYPVGYPFINEAMLRLDRSRIRTSDALNLLIQNPPKTLVQMRSGTEYANKLTRRRK